jgi:hypothetical protein
MIMLLAKEMSVLINASVLFVQLLDLEGCSIFVGVAI